jgi:hypothetical protein
VKLIGDLSHKFGLQLSERIIEKHYEVYRHNVTTGRDDHMREFRNAWKSFRNANSDSDGNSYGYAEAVSADEPIQ